MKHERADTELLLRLRKNLLWLDCTAAAVAGVLVVLLSGPLSTLEGLPRGLLLFTGAVNLLYGSFSFSLARRPRRSRQLIKLLVIGNLAWAPICFGLAAAFAGVATSFGLLHLVGEGVFVGSLAMLEWANRDLLLTAPSTERS